MFGDTASIQGGLLLIVSSCGALALLHLYWAAANDGTTRKTRPGSAADHWARRLTVLIALASLSVIPLSGSFWGEFMILQSIFRRDAAAAFWLIVAAMVLAISLRHCWHEFVPKVQSASDTDDSGLSRPASSTRIMPLMPIVFVLAAAALAPQWILGPPQMPDPDKADAAFLPGVSIQSVNDEPVKSLSLAKSAPNAE